MANSFGGQGVGTNYRGTNAQQPPNLTFNTRNPNQYDTKNVSLGDLWMNTSTEELWVLMSLQGTASSLGMLADWVLLTGASGTVISLSSNNGFHVPPDIDGNIRVVGDGTTIVGVGDIATNTITFGAGGEVATEYVTDSGTAVPVIGELDILGGTAGRDIRTSASGNVIHVDLKNAITLGDLALLTANNDAITLTSGDLTLSGTGSNAAGNINLPSCAASRLGVIESAGLNFIHSYPGVTAAAPGPANTFIGQQCGNFSHTSAGGLTGVGGFVMTSITTGQDNTCVGQAAGNAISTASGCTIVGKDAATVLTTGSSNTIIGTSAAYNSGGGTGLLTGAQNIIIGAGAGEVLAGAESNNLLIGHNGLTGTSGLIAIAVPGNAVPYVHNWGAGNSFFGRSGNLTLTPGTAVNNTASGNTAMSALTLGFDNAAFGNASMQNITTGSSNAAIGAGAMQLATTSAQCTAVGNGSLSKINAAANQNVGIGYQAGSNLLTGTGNILIGVSAGTAYTGAESGNIIIGSVGVIGESNKTKIGGIRGATTTNNDAVAVLIDSAGQLGTVSSSIRYKDNVQDMGDESSNIMNLRPVTFNYKQSKAMQYGLIAEDVAMVMPRLAVMDSEGNPETVKYHELPQLILNELIKLSKRVEELEKKLQ